MSDQKRKIRVCNGPTCGAQFASDIMKKCETHYGNKEDIELDYCACTGHCSLANNVVIDDDIIISRNTPENVTGNIDKALEGDIYGAGGGTNDVDPYNLEDDQFLGI
jgi:NADH:ubiquinone oxidoreductase subunit E